MQESDWENRYQTGQTGWDRGDSSDNLSFWLEKVLLTKCKILIPGCGNGYEVLTLAEKGFDVTAIDIAPTPIKNLQVALDNAKLKATLIEADFFNWQVETQFDAIYEQTSLCALSPTEWSTYEECLYKWLKPSGKLFAQFMQTGVEGGPPYHCAMDDMRKLFVDEKWQWSSEYLSSEDEFNDKAEILYLLEKK